MHWPDPRTLLGLLLPVIVLACPGVAAERVAAEGQEAAWAALHEPGHVAFLRHAAAPGVADAVDMDVDDCSTQRNLEEEGRLQAAAIGARLRARGVDGRAVFTSRVCRARETAARIEVGPVYALAGLDSYFGDDERKAIVLARLRAFLRDLEPGLAPILVTHTPNIHEVTGERPEQGGMVVARLRANGRVESIGVIPPPTP